MATAAANAGIDLTLDTKDLERAFLLGPSTAFYWLRGFLFGSFLKHRTYWLRAKGTKFGRGDDKSKAIKVWRINDAPAGVQDNWVVYRINPKEQRLRDPRAAEQGLKQLGGAAAAGSLVLEVHQKGTDIDVPGKWLTIPLRTRPRTPRAWRKKNPGKVLITIPDRRNPGRLYLYERIRYRGRRAEGVKARDEGKKKVVRDLLRRRFLLVHHIDMKPTLGFYESWDAGRSERDTEFRRTADRIVEDIARGKLT